LVSAHRVAGGLRSGRPARASLNWVWAKVMTLTSTYDHRIIQGAESGLFLKFVAECLTGQHDFSTRSSRRSGSRRAGALGFGPNPRRTKATPSGS